MAAYEPYCDGAFECWTTKHLENFVNVIAGATAVTDAEPRETCSELPRLDVTNRGARGQAG